MATTDIRVTACDNELILIASSPAGSAVLCHLKSGYNAPVDYQVNPRNILPSGNYTLTMIGVNWGGPSNFEVTVTNDGRPEHFSSPGGGETGVSWSQTTQISV